MNMSHEHSHDGAAPDDAIPAKAPVHTMEHSQHGPNQEANGAHAVAGHDSQHGMAHNMSDPAMAASMETDIRHRFWISLVLSILIVVLSPMGAMIGISVPISTSIRSWVLLMLTTPVVFYCGWMFISGAYHALRSFKLDMAVLIAVGVLAAYIASAYLTFIGSSELFYEAAAMLVTFVLFGHWMEMKSRRGTNDALKELFLLIPPKARVIREGKEIEIATAEVKMGDEVVLRPGDRVPVDGKVVSGESALDEALITGESAPVVKRTGDKIVGGSVNGNGTLTFSATAVGADATLNRIAKLVETAQNSKAPAQRIADKAAGYLVVLAVGAGVVTFVAWYFGAGTSFVTALTFAISAVVIACPDALGLATPTAVAVGTGLGAKHHILIKDAATLEAASRITAVILDKTGTLTEGKPRVTQLLVTEAVSDVNAIAIMAAMEQRSSHPLALAILDEARKRGITSSSNVTDFQNVTGHGLKARVDGKAILLGNARLLESEHVPLDALPETFKTLLASGTSVMLMSIDGRAAAIVAIEDPIKPSAKKAIGEFKKLGIETAILSGDNEVVVKAVAQEIGVERTFAEVLPEAKADYVKKLQAEGKFVAMVGDGVNDAPALAQADIGIAIGAGTNVATEAAKIVLMQSDPLDIINAIILSKATVTKMRQNLVWASVYNVLAIPVAAGAFYTWLGWSLRPEVSALLMSASSIIVASNAVLLRRAEHKFILGNTEIH